MNPRSIAVAAVAAAALLIPSSASSAACKVDGFKITKRQNVTCKTAKAVTRKQAKGQARPAGWKCTAGSSVIP